MIRDYKEVRKMVFLSKSDIPTGQDSFPTTHTPQLAEQAREANNLNIGTKIIKERFGTKSNGGDC